MKPLSPTHPAYTFEPMPLDEAARRELPDFSEPSFFAPALSRTQAPTSESIEESLEEGTLQLWRMYGRDKRQVAIVLFNEWTSIASIYVYVAPDGLFVPKLASAALEALVVAIFAAEPETKDILTQVKLPQHPDTEETLAQLGFETIGTRREYEAQQRSYWLKRQIWDAYRGG